MTLTVDQTYLSADAQDLIDQLPTVIGGIAKVIHNPMYLMDLEPGGSLHLVCAQFGRFRHENGYQIEKLIGDLSLLRQKLWVFCERIVPPAGVDFFELERRLNLAVDRVTVAVVDAYYNRSCAELIELAQKDKLTGFLHLKAFGQVLDRELARSKRYRQALSMVSIDIDNFKQFNLEEGRLEGNQLLRAIAREILGVVRSIDFAARLGGDEFAILMPQTTAQRGCQAAERIRRRVRQLRRDEHMATVSVGIAAYPEDAGSKEDLIKKARSAMRRAQRDGGDIVRVKGAYL